MSEGYAYSASGVFGDATLATREKGKKLTEALVAVILRDIETVRAAPPPPASSSAP
jgi:creatinine amidohydrolase